MGHKGELGVIKEGALALGTYQHIVHVELDTRARERRVLVTIMGE